METLVDLQIAETTMIKCQTQIHLASQGLAFEQLRALKLPGSNVF